MPTRISKLTLGTAQLGMPSYGIARSGHFLFSDIRKLVCEGVDLGVTSFDTSPGYGDAELFLGKIFGPNGWPEEAIVISKLPHIAAEIESSADLVKVVSQAVECSRVNLKKDLIDIYLIHDWGNALAAGHRLVEVLEQQIAAGRVGRIGASLYTSQDVLDFSAMSELMVSEIPVSLLDQRMLGSGSLAKLHAGGRTVLARSVLLQGLIALEPQDLPKNLASAAGSLGKLRNVLMAYGLEPTSAAVAFVASIPEIDSVVVGVDSVEQLRNNVEAIRTPLAPDLIRELRDLGAKEDEAFLDPRTW